MLHKAGCSGWSILLPFYNEAGFIGATLRSLAAQTLAPEKIILVDNGSTDASRAEIESVCAEHPGLPIDMRAEERPGKASALKTGLTFVETPFVATCDADAYYPPEYLNRCNAMLSRDGGKFVAAVALDDGGAGWKPRLKRICRAISAALMPTQAHGGGYAQSFRTDALLAVGGFGPDIWPYCLMDHEVIHRISKVGAVAYDLRHWCAPSMRRIDRRRVRWSLSERLIYHTVRRRWRDWYFYDYLGPRLANRGVSELKLREKPWLTT